DDELVARVGDRPCRQLETVADRGRHLLDRAAAGQVAPRVHHALEMVEVDEEYREGRAAVAGGGGDERLERLVEVAGVVETRQVVADRRTARKRPARAESARR